MEMFHATAMEIPRNLGSTRDFDLDLPRGNKVKRFTKVKLLRRLLTCVKEKMHAPENPALCVFKRLYCAWHANQIREIFHRRQATHGTPSILRG
jgi:hypothetical protein